MTQPQERRWHARFSCTWAESATGSSTNPGLVPQWATHCIQLQRGLGLCMARALSRKIGHLYGHRVWHEG